MASRREITKKFARAHVRAGRAERGRLLDALAEATGWHRDYARRAIRNALARKGAAGDQQRAPRPRKQSYDELRSMSATIDRYLKPHRDARYPQALGATKPSHILRSSIPVRTAMDPLPPRPGSYELDTVAHCGHTTKGEYLRTLTATDPGTGWTLVRAIRNNAHINIRAGTDWLRRASPVPIQGTDFDDGSEFLDWSVIAWCDEHGIPVTRGRPCQHNDNAHVEQRNGDWVRRHAFRFRYETDTELRLLNQLHALVMNRENHLLPCVKATGWTHTNSGRTKRVYDTPRTPYQRLLDAGVLDATTRAALQTEHAELDPAATTRRILGIQKQLVDLAAARTQGTRPAA